MYGVYIHLFFKILNKEPVFVFPTDSRSDVKPTALEQKRKACAPQHIKSAQIHIHKRNGNNTGLK